MAIAIQTDAELVKVPRDSSNATLVRRVQLGATVTAGMPVCEASDGKFDPADATDVTLSFVDGVALQGGVDGDWVDMAYAGPVECLTGATPGSLVYLSDTAGAVSHSAGTKTTIIGKAITDMLLMINIQIVSLS